MDFENASTEIGYEIAKEHWRNGYALEAIQALIDQAFSTFGMKRIDAKLAPNNTSSIKLLEKLHFSYNGMIKEYEQEEDRHHDLILYSLFIHN